MNLVVQKINSFKYRIIISKLCMCKMNCQFQGNHRFIYSWHNLIIPLQTLPNRSITANFCID